MSLRRVTALLLLLLVVLPLKAEPLADFIGHDLQAPETLAPLVCGEHLYSTITLVHFYTARQDAPVWVNNHDPLPAAGQMLNAIRESRNDGLRPLDYHFHAINSLLDSLNAPDINADMQRKRLAALDILLSDAFLTLAGDQRYGRVDPGKLDPPAGGEIRRNMGPELQAVLNGSDPQTLIRGLVPKTKEYTAMRAALARYRALQARGGLPSVAPGKPMRLGDRGERVAQLIAHLQADGNLPGDATSGTLFNAWVQHAVKEYQSSHGLKSDGIAGTDTLALLNHPASNWLNILRVNLDRLRRLPRTVPATRLVVNIADFHARLWEQGRIKMTAKVIVGQPGKQTPEFNDWIRYLVVNPAWDVPPSIAGEELLPDVQKDPGYLKKHGYEVLQGWGADEHLVDPSSIDWKQWTQDTLPYHFRQKPGPENPLGRVKFMFPNRYDVYLHDTPAQHLFNASQCTFSHGCIRVAHAMELAAELLRLDGRKHPAKLLKQAVTSGKTLQIDLSNPIPIYIVYLTAWVNDSGMLEFRRDFYERDPQVLNLLNAPVLGNLQCSVTSE